MDIGKLFEYLLLWSAVLAVMAVVRTRRKTPGAGLTLAYLLNLSLIHWIGAAIYVLPAFQNQDSLRTELGFEQSFFGLAAFAFGALVFTPLLANRGLLRQSTTRHRPDMRLPKAYIAAGVVFYMLSSTFFGRLPTATAIITAGQQLIVAGLCLCCWKARQDGDFRKLTSWVMLACLMPFATLLTQGFLGYGVVALLVVLIFVSSFVRSPLKIVLVGLPVIYLGLSVFVSYMRDRADIRSSVWGGESFSARIDKVAETIATFEWFDIANQDHLKRIDSRLNQNYLVGAAVVRLAETDNYARGETLWDALLALIPRAVWPDKRIEAGSGDLVTRYTGVEFQPGVSVGVGQAMEFYINFGTLGVVVGFMLMGVLVTTLDWQAGERLARSDLHGFVLWFVPGISLLQVGGQLVEVTASFAASLVVALLVNKYLDRLQGKQGAKVATQSPMPPELGREPRSA
jgi:hypothetical protein